jgi:hypothetical protein
MLRGSMRDSKAEWFHTFASVRPNRIKRKQEGHACFSHLVFCVIAAMRSVRQSAKRLRTPDVLPPEEITALLGNLPEPLRTTVELDAFTASTSTGEMAKFQAYVRYFQKYAAEYNFDYLMLVAQGYQESLLDQSRKNPSEAVGIMQVIPKNAAAPLISISNMDIGTTFRLVYFWDSRDAQKHLSVLKKSVNGKR